MKRTQITENFYLDEFIDPAIYSVRGDKSISLLDFRIVEAAQFIREQSGQPVKINDWAKGGRFRERGLRRHDTATGARWSQHKYGRAIDINIGTWTPQEMLDFVMQHERYLVERQWVTVIEDVAFTKSWLHLDCRYTGTSSIVIVQP